MNANPANIPPISIVIGFRDWGIDRLAVSLASHRSKAADAEVIVVDFGSLDGAGVASVVEKYGCHYHRIEAPLWSRAQALNAGIKIARSEFVVTTDADIIFSKGCYNACLDALRNDPNIFVSIQCWDLPSDLPLEKVESKLDTELSSCSRPRPRWGVGGFCGFRKSIWNELNGFDNRLLVWGGEDTDFVLRMNRLGFRQLWMMNPEHRIFHIHHSPSPRSHDGVNFERRNRDIVYSDQSIIRNITNTTSPPNKHVAPPSKSVTVVIATRNRASYLGDCLRSIARQTVRPDRVIIIDDGSTDPTPNVATQNYDGLRVDYFQSNKRGIAASRNLGTSLTETRYICVMDDDDLMLPNRIADHLNAFQRGTNATTGGWINFDVEARSLCFNPGRPSPLDAIFYQGSSMAHGTTMYETALLREFPYTEAFEAGVDFDFHGRLARFGARITSTDSYVLLRRLHANSVTQSETSKQKSAGRARGLLHLMSLTQQADNIARERSRKLRLLNYQEPKLSDISALLGFEPSSVAQCVETSKMTSNAATIPSRLGRYVNRQLANIGLEIRRR